jgi:Tfp pilus assembly protein PilF
VTWVVPVGLAAAIWAWRRAAPWAVVAAALMVLGVGPVLGLVTFDFQRFSTVADHYLCLAMLGPALAVAFAIRTWGRRAVVPAVLVVLLLAGRSFAQAWVWRDSETLFHHALAVNPGSLAANGVLAVRASNDGRIDEAQAYFERALATRPNDSITLFNYGNALMRAGDVGGAIERYGRAAASNPRHAPTRNNYGIALMRAGRPGDAIVQFREAVRIDLRYAEGQLNLGQALAAAGDPAGAVEHLRRALELNPGLTKARAMLQAIEGAPASGPVPGR